MNAETRKGECGVEWRLERLKAAAMGGRQKNKLSRTKDDCGIEKWKSEGSERDGERDEWSLRRQGTARLLFTRFGLAFAT